MWRLWFYDTGLTFWFCPSDGGGGVLPDRPWLLQCVCHVCGHTLPLLLWVHLYFVGLRSSSCYLFTLKQSQAKQLVSSSLCHISDCSSLCLVSPFDFTLLLFSHIPFAACFPFCSNFPLTQSNTLRVRPQTLKRRRLGKKWRLLW